MRPEPISALRAYPGNFERHVDRYLIAKWLVNLNKFLSLQVKMSLITAAYFREGDFGNVAILEEAYHNLNACLSPALLSTPEAFVGKLQFVDGGLIT